ncbi:MAG: hypothetical protein KDD82_01680, partial [Planctomycetes bacterium]|nr:hypothetical protein [Planctomycetota bacterium]
LADVPAERLRAYLGAFSSDRAASLLPSEAFDAWFQRAEALSARHEDLIPALRQFRSRIPAPPQPADQADR